MPTYITLANYTQKGIENVDQSTDRLEDAKAVAENAGGEVKEFYLTFGRYDIVTVSEFPNDEAAAQVMLTIGREGAVETETLKAFTEDEYRDVVAGLE